MVIIILLKAVIQNISTCEPILTGILLYDDDIIQLFYQLETDEEELSQEIIFNLENIVVKLEKEISLFKSKTDDYNMQDLKGFINLTIHKYFVHTQLVHTKIYNTFISRFKIFINSKNLTIKLFTKEELENYKTKVQIHKSIKFQNDFVKQP